MTDTPWWDYEQRQSRVDIPWTPASRGDSPWDALDFHLDIGCGTVPKARIGIDRYAAEGVDLLMDLDTLLPVARVEEEGLDPFTVEQFDSVGLIEDDPALPIRPGLPFPTDSIESIITHHCLEHIDQGFIPLMDECHRILKPGGFMRIIVPLFPSQSAVCDPDHRRYFMEGVWQTFCGTPDGSHWMESFSVPYTSCRFELVSEDCSPPTPIEKMWTPEDARETRVTLRKWPR